MDNSYLPSVQQLLARAWETYETHWKKIIKTMLFGKLLYLPAVAVFLVLLIIIYFIGKPYGIKPFAEPLTLSIGGILLLLFVVSTTIIGTTAMIAMFFLLYSPDQYISQKELYDNLQFL